MSRFVSLCSWGREAVTCYGLVCFSLLLFVLPCSYEKKTVTCYDLLSIVFLGFALQCSALLALHCSFVE